MTPDLLIEHFDRISSAPNAVARLRDFILDLAVRGKLIQHEPREEHASTLLREIQTRKSLLGIRNVPSKIIPANERPFAIPHNWLWVELGDICSKTGSGSTPRGGKSVYQRAGIPFLRSQNIHNEGLRLEDVEYITAETHEKMSGTALEAGDLLLNITGGSIGRCCVVPASMGPANVSQHVAIIRIAVDGMQQYFHRLILSPYFQSFVLSEQTGAGRGGLPKNRMDRIPIALPPLTEQHRIVEKLSDLMALCDQLEASHAARDQRRSALVAAANHHLINAGDPGVFRARATFYINTFTSLTVRKSDIEQLRQTIRSLAVRGLLVSQDAKEEPASVLSSRVSAEIRTFTQEYRITLPRPDPIKEEEIPFPAPSGWLWTRLCSLFNVITDGDHQPPPKSDAGVAFLTIGNITTGSIDFANCRYVPQSYFESVATYRRPAIGDILYTVVGATYGRPALVDSDRPFCVQRHIAILKPTSQIDAIFLCLLLASPFVYQQATRAATGTAQPTVALKPLRNFLVPLPPLAEQARIVAKVNVLMALCDELEARITSDAEVSRQLLEAVLDKAINPVTQEKVRELIAN